MGDLWKLHGYRLKVYSISHQNPSVPPGLLQASRVAVEAYLRLCPTGQRSHGAGFVTVHEGRNENQVNLDRWVNQVELLHTVFVSSLEAPARMAPPPADHNAMGVWEMAVQAFERETWLTHVLQRPEAPDFEGYFTARLEGTI
jgi:hypothetical protein